MNTHFESLGDSTEQMNEELNHAACSYYAQLERKRAAEEEGLDYKDMVALSETRTEFFDILYRHLLYFYCPGLSDGKRAAIAREGLTTEQLSRHEEALERISEVYAELLERIPALPYDCERPFANYLHATIAPKMRSSFERYIPEGDLQILAKLKYLLEREEGCERQNLREKARRRVHKTSAQEL